MKKSLVIILKNPGTSCNIGCTYCAEERKKYVSVDRVITEKQLNEIANLSKECSLNVLFHGGEPTLLSCEYYENAMNIFQRVNNDVFFGIQTNATRLDKNWIKFLKNNKRRMGISVSLDGPRDINRFRLTKDKKETYDLVKENIKLLGDNGIKTGMICTIVSTAINKEYELYKMLNEFDNLQFVKLNPCMDRNEDGTVPFWAVTPQQYFDFVSNFFDIMLKESAWNKFYIEPIISVLKNLQGIKSSFCNYSGKKCSYFISIYPDGTITSCDNYSLQSGFIGKIDDVDSLESIIRFQNNIELKNSYVNLMKECINCNYIKICTGGCIATRERYSDTNEYCQGMTSMINHIKEVYKSVL